MAQTIFKTKKLLTLPLLKFAEGAPRYVRVTSKVFLGKTMKAKEGEKARDPAHLAGVIDLETGAVAQIIVSAVVASVWSDEYSNDTYVGKCFAITKQGRVPGKQYVAFDVAEIEDPEAASEVTKTVKK